MTATIQETIETLQRTLLGYIEATYHVADPSVVRQRRQLLEEVGGIFQSPFLESTPRYQTGKYYAEMGNLPQGARDLYMRLSDSSAGKPLLFDPPYIHQAEAIEGILVERRNLMIMTGTGSGKTESFLLPIIGKFAVEAHDKPEQFAKHHAVRAMVLYPMNALVNDQLGRLRSLFGDPRVVSTFEQWSGRPALFARYTSRTPYAGVRTRQKDSRRLKSIGDFFVDIEDAAGSVGPNTSPQSPKAKAAGLQRELHKRGKWPGKPSINEWFGSGNWLDANGEFRRAVTRAGEAELLTRYEVQVSPPDLLITNYSMLEYMMLRPIERPIFDQTRAWLKACPDEKFLIVLDEAHLYRGAQGAEVGLLLRRLRERLDIPAERFQVICATASFSAAGKATAGDFGGQLSGADPSSFRPITGELKLQPGEGDGDEADAAALCSVDMARFYSDIEAEREQSIAPFLAYRAKTSGAGHGPDLYTALSGWAPFSRLVNATMVSALSFDEVREQVFPKVGSAQGDQAINALLALGSRARLKPDDASLLPCRIHAFYRGLPGLWACTDPDCHDLPAEGRGGPVGRLYSQPRARCGCNAPVLEYFTCRYCGTSYARAYTKDVSQPRQIFADAGHQLLTADGFIEALQPLDLLLEPPATATLGVPAIYDLVTGRLDPPHPSDRTRTVYLAPSTVAMAGQADNGDDEDDDHDEVYGDGRTVGAGQFAPCGCCQKYARGNQSSVQDHATKGDQPFQALLASQIKVQPPSPKEATEFAPLRGRKVLVFSDSRQVAARLAPTLQNFSFKDTIRALLPRGYRMLEEGLPAVVLDNAYMAVIVAAHRFGVRLRPGLESSELMPSLKDTAPGDLPDAQELMALINEKPPVNLTRAIVDTLRDNVLGLEALAVASVREAPKHTQKLTSTLPNLPGLAETPEAKLAVVRAWLRAWLRKPGVWFKDMPPGWWGTGGLVRAHRGEFRPLRYIFSTPALKSAFRKDWLPVLLPLLTESINGQYRMVARNLTLEIGGSWRRCNQCTSVHRPISTLSICIDCNSKDVHAFDPDADDVFQARKGFYRGPVVDALTSDQPALMSLIAAEHTAQLNAARPDEAFSRAEHHEMRFQDIDLAWRNTDVPDTAIDVLSSTTTMEVGIDIGELSGVALRNMPPGRANYQQRAGRAGRRGNAVATVVAFGSADSHDDHYFTRPQEMIRGDVVDPRLTLENPDIARRHIRAFVLQRYHEARLPDLDQTTESAANLFSVLGKVGDFRDSTGILNRVDLAEWLELARNDLVTALQRWLPKELLEADRAKLIADFVPDLLAAIDEATGGQPPLSTASEPDHEEVVLGAPEIGSSAGVAVGGEDGSTEEDPQPDAEELVDVASDNLLDRLLYWGVLPRYAFPTDVAPFYVFSPNSTGFRHEMEFAPSQGLNVALSQYAPNKQIWIAGKQYTSRAIYSPIPHDRKNAWGRRKLYYECTHCGHAKTTDFDPEHRGETLTCEACQTPGTFGPSKPWFRPPGFAHLWDQPAVTTPDEPNETAYATRAKLVMSTGDQDFNQEINARLRGLATRRHLLVSNSGPNGDGYEYCARCGRIESVASPEVNLRQPHTLPFPNEGDPNCPGAVSRGVVLGVEFVTDIALFSLDLEAPIRLPPPNAETASAMRTVCEAVAKAASQLLEIEPGEILAEHRPALNDDGAAGTVVEVFLYDTLAGGAGFSPQMASRGSELFCKALEIIEQCPADCDASCYRCLRGFRNRLDHNLLDRKLGAQVLRQVMTGVTPPYSPGRARSSVELLATELKHQFSDQFDVIKLPGSATQAPISLTQKSTGKVTLVDLHSPVAPNVPLFATQIEGAVLIDELVVRKNLGEAVAKVASAL
ncbi:MAG: DEAD/DEAH box helicase [Pseudomonadota bacterium]